MLSRVLTLLSVVSRAPKSGLLTVSGRDGERLASIAVHEHQVFLVRSTVRKPRLHERLTAADPITATAFAMAVGKVRRSSRRVQGLVGILPELQVDLVRGALFEEFRDEFEALARHTRGSSLNMSWMPLEGHPPPHLAVEPVAIFRGILARRLVREPDRASRFFERMRGIADASLLVALDGEAEDERALPVEVTGLDSFRLFQLDRLARTAHRLSSSAALRQAGQSPWVTSVTLDGSSWLTVAGKRGFCFSRFDRAEVATRVLGKLNAARRVAG